MYVPLAAAALLGKAGLRPLRLFPHKFDVRTLVSELACHPELWNDFALRTDHPASPHREMDDIIVRYNARVNFSGDRDVFNGPHDSVWWDAIEKLPSVYRLVWDLMYKVEGERLGMVLITRQPPGATWCALATSSSVGACSDDPPTSVGCATTLSLPSRMKAVAMPSAGRRTYWERLSSWKSIAATPR